MEYGLLLMRWQHWFSRSHMSSLMFVKDNFHKRKKHFLKQYQYVISYAYLCEEECYCLQWYICQFDVRDIYTFFTYISPSYIPCYELQSQSTPYNMTAICYVNIALFTKLDDRYYASVMESCMGKYLVKITCGDLEEPLDR